MTDRYTRFVPHEDNVEEIISSEHVNVIQERAQKNQQELFRQDDVDFLDRALFVLENHPVVNSLYIDLGEDETKVDMLASTGIVHSEEERAFSFSGDDVIDATLFGAEFVNPNSTAIKQIILMANYTAPLGSDLTFQLSNNGVQYYEVIPNEASIFEFPTTGSKLTVRVRFRRTTNVESPLLKGYGVIFRDATHVIDFAGLDQTKGECVDCGTNPFTGYSHQDLTDVGTDDHHPQVHAHDGTDGSGLVSHKVLTDIGEDDHHSKDHRHGQDGIEPVHLETDVIGTLGMEHLSYILKTGEPGDLVLTRNPQAQDRLVKVVSPESDTYLLYDWLNEGRLDTIVTIYGDLATIEKLNYGFYGPNIVMTGTTKSIKDATDAEVLALIATVMKPSP